MRCRKCEFDNPPGMKFCGKCRTSLALICPSCSFENPAGFDFCGQCAAALHGGSGVTQGAAAAAKPGATVRVVAGDPSLPVDGERKTVTALFADLKGSTQLMEALDPEEAGAIINPALRIMVAAVRRYEGYVVQSTGDGIFALFGAPAAYEDHPQRALYAALQMQRELHEYGQRRAAEGARPLEARVGVNTGEVVVRAVETGGKVEYTPIGHTANLASRLQTVAPAGSIAISEHTRKLCEGYFELRGLGSLTVKGISAPINAYEVIGMGPLRTHFQLAARRGLTKFVGRERELEQMQRALELAMRGHGQIVAVMAEAGTGKSRLFYEFKATLPPICKVLEAYSVSYGKSSAWLPALELLRDFFNIQDADDAASRREKIRATVTTLDPALDDTLPYLFALLGIVEGPDPMAQTDPQIKRQRTLDAIKRIVLRESLNQPLVVIFEDLHWIDAQTQALLDLLADGLARTNVLLLVNYRPEYRHEWTNKSYYSQLRLDPLGGADGLAMLSALLGESVELNPLKRLIAERTGGNPFFIEEIVQALFDEGVLVRDGAVKLTRSLSQLQLPPTAQGMLAARIDRLATEQKELLQTLAVIGRESSLGLMRQVVSDTDSQMERMLADLQAAEFIYEQPATTGVEYVFKHALTQEVAYHSMLIERRKHLHETTGQAMESLFAGQLDDHLTQLAHHYSHSDNVDKAVEYLGRVAQQAMQRCSYIEAIKYVSDGLDRLKTLPDNAERAGHELSLQITLGASLMTTKGWAVPEVEQAFSRARALCRRMGEVPQLAPVLYGIWAFYVVRGELQRAREIGTQLLTLAETIGNPIFVVAAHYTLGTTLYWMGELAASLTHFDELIRHYAPAQHRTMAALFGLDPGIVGVAYTSMNLRLMGFPDKALETIERAGRMARETAHSESLAWTLVIKCEVSEFRHETRQVRAEAEEAYTVCEPRGLVMQAALAKLFHGWALAFDGDPELGCSEIRDAFRAFSAPGLILGEAQAHTILAGVYLYAGDAEKGLGSFEEPLTATKSEERNFAAELCRLRGELLLLRASTKRVDASAEAESLFRRAIQIAQKQSAKSLELRATVSLARLLERQVHRDEARAMLAEIYSWFTEGFDTADLKDAKALLDDLRA